MGSHEMLHAETQMSIPPKYEQDCNSLDTVPAGAQASPKQPRSNRDLKYSKYYTLQQLARGGQWSSSTLIHDALRSGTEKAMDSGARRARSCRMVRHPSTGLNLLMSGADRLDGNTGIPPAVSQRSESGQGILGAQEGRGLWVVAAVVVAVLSSRMSPAAAP